MLMLNNHKEQASEKLGTSAMHPLLWTEQGVQRTLQTASTFLAGLQPGRASAPER